MGKAVGIDLGTTNSVVAIVQAGEPVVIPNQEQVDRHVFAIADELVLALGQLQSAAFQQVDRVFGQATGLLHRNFYALLG